MNKKQKCEQFLISNGWKKQESFDGFYYEKNGVCGIEICDDEIVLLDDSGDFLHIPINYYALIGALIHFSQIGVGYKHGE